MAITTYVYWEPDPSSDIDRLPPETNFGAGAQGPVGPAGVAAGIPGVVALRALTDHDDNAIAVLLWHTTEGDGGHGTVYYDAGSSTADDNLTVFKPDDVAGAGRWKRIQP